jgi:hypothetical protein
MGVDTAAKRFSIMNLGSPWRGPMIVPSGTVNAAERLAFLYLYNGIPAGGLVTVQDVVGQSQAAGTALLVGDGFVVSVSTEYSSTVQAGFIISQSPTGGSSAPFGSAVAIVVSLGEAARNTGAGRSSRRKRRYEVEIDGEVFDVESVAEATAILEKVKELAEEKAAEALNRASKSVKRPVRKVLADARKALPIPEIRTDAPVSDAVNALLSEIADLYRSTIQTIEIGALLRRREDEDDEEVLLLSML